MRAGLSPCPLSSDDLDPEELQLEMGDPRPPPAVQCSPAPGERAPWVRRAGCGAGLLQNARSRCSKASSRGAGFGEGTFISEAGNQAGRAMADSCPEADLPRMSISRQELL